jgi:biotin carboxyl carrier protein
LPASLARLVGRQALELDPNRFEADIRRLIRAVEKTLAEERARREAEAEQRQPANDIEQHGEMAIARRSAVPAQDAVTDRSRDAALDVSERMIDLGDIEADDELDPERIYVWRRGGGSIDWRVETRATWLSVTRDANYFEISFAPGPGRNYATVEIHDNVSGEVHIIRVQVRRRQRSGGQAVGSQTTPTVPAPVQPSAPAVAAHAAADAAAAVPVTMPRLGEKITEGTVTRWLKSVGDTVEADEPLLEVSTDKVDTEIPAPAAGVVARIVVAEDETAEVGTHLAYIRGRRTTDVPAAADPTSAISVIMPALGESVTEGTVTRWLKSVGDTVEADEPLLEVSTDKVDTEIPAPAAGVLARIVVGEDETAKVGTVLARILPYG